MKMMAAVVTGAGIANLTAGVGLIPEEKTSGGGLALKERISDVDLAQALREMPLVCVCVI